MLFRKIIKMAQGGVYLLALVALASGCAGNDLAPDAAPDDMLTHADQLIENGKHYDAAETLEFFLRSHPGNSRIPYAKLRLGDARFGLDEFVLARGRYEDVVEDHPASPYVEEARFKVAQCAYSLIHSHDRDPTDTQEALRLLEEFRRTYPQSRFLDQTDQGIHDCRERLARKEFEAGRFYERRRRLRSAKVQYEHVLNEYPQSAWASRACFRIAEIYRIREKWDVARNHYQRVLRDYPESAEAELAEQGLARVQAQDGGHS